MRVGAVPVREERHAEPACLVPHDECGVAGHAPRVREEVLAGPRRSPPREAVARIVVSPTAAHRLPRELRVLERVHPVERRRLQDALAVPRAVAEVEAHPARLVVDRAVDDAGRPHVGLEAGGGHRPPGLLVEHVGDRQALLHLGPQVEGRALHAERPPDALADVVLVGDAAEALHEMADQGERHVGVHDLAQRRAPHPEGVGQVLAERERGGLSPHRVRAEVDRHPRGVRQQVAEPDRILGILPANLEPVQVGRDRIVELEGPPLHLLQQGHGRLRLERRADQVDGLRRRRRARPQVGAPVGRAPQLGVAVGERDREGGDPPVQHRSPDLRLERRGDAGHRGGRERCGGSPRPRCGTVLRGG